MILPYLILAGLISASLFFNRNKMVTYVLLCAFVVLQFTITTVECSHMGISESGYFVADSLSILLLLILSVLCVPAFIHSIIFLEGRNNSAEESNIYFAAMVVLMTSLTAAYLSSHIVITWIFVELTTLSVSALVFHKRHAKALEATWKYIFVCSISVTLVFIGILFLSMAMHAKGVTDLSYDTLITQAPFLDVFWLKLAFIFIFTGFTSKLGLVPMYAAGIDAKDNAPSPAGALISSVLVNVGFVGIFHIYEIVSHTAVVYWANKIMLISGILSLFFATVYMLHVKNIKRMLAYSGVEHMSLVVIGLASGGIGPYAAVLHIVLHSFVKPALFFQIGQVHRVYQSKSIYDIGNYFKYNVSGAMVLLFAFFTVTGMPPSGMFTSEFLIFRALFEDGNYGTLILVLFLLTLIIWALGKNIFKMLFLKPVHFKEINIVRINPLESVSQFILLALVIYLGIAPPQVFVDLLQGALINIAH
ncbi:MAG: proton-conducting transporter membrane subunit [bacterium]|nr:proton-conducting transporter membrane subunit [bacterium]